MIRRRLLHGRAALPLLAALFALVIATAPASAAGGWSNPVQAGTVTGCRELSLALDAGGARHLAAECGGTIRYFTNVSGTWTTTAFGHPAGQVDIVPHVSIDGGRVYVAYTRGTPFPTCGIDATRVYYRSKPVSGGTWSSPIRLGVAGDRLEDFEVRDGILHATVLDAASDVQYETTANGELERYLLPGSVFESSLAVGSDGVARIVYTTEGLIRYALFHGSGVEWQAIPGATAAFIRPELALDGDNRAHVIYTSGPLALHRFEGPLCGIDVDSPIDGTYYVTNRTGEWTPGGNSRRFTKNAGTTSFSVNPRTGTLHVLVAGPTAVKYYTKTTSSAWSGVTISSSDASDVSIALRVSTGQLVGAYSQLIDGEYGGTFTLSKP